MNPTKRTLTLTSFVLLLLHTTQASATPHSIPTFECQVCIDTLTVLANYSLDDPKRVDRLLAHMFDAASAAGICATDGGLSGLLTPDVCLGAISEYGPLVANIIAARPPLVRETMKFVCEALKLCPIASLSAEHARGRGAACESVSSPAHDVTATPPSYSPGDAGEADENVGTFVVITDVHWDPDYSPGIGPMPRCNAYSIFP